MTYEEDSLEESSLNQPDCNRLASSEPSFMEVSFCGRLGEPA